MNLDNLATDLKPEILAHLKNYLNQNTQLADGLIFAAFFDAQGLSCPMPLLKAKITLRQVPSGESLYLLASDKNSQTDICAFCQKNHLEVVTWQSSISDDTIYHFIITQA